MCSIPLQSWHRPCLRVSLSSSWCASREKEQLVSCGYPPACRKGAWLRDFDDGWCCCSTSLLSVRDEWFLTTSQKRRLTHLWVCRSLIFFTTNLRYSLSNVLRKSTIDSPQTQLNHGFRCSTKSRRPQDEWIIRSYSAEIFLPRMRTGWELQMSPSDHYWRRYLVGQWLVFGWFGGCGTSDTRLARRKLGKKNTPQPWRPPSSHGRHGAPPQAPPQTTIIQHAMRQV